MKIQIYFILIFYYSAVLSGYSQITETSFIPNKLIAKIKIENKKLCSSNNISHNKITDLLNNGDIKKIQQKFPACKLPDYTENNRQVDISTIYEITFDVALNMDKLQNYLINTGIFDYVEKYYLPRAFFVPNDPYADTNNAGFNQYALLICKIFEAWDFEQGDTNVVVGIIDSGTDFNHPDLQDNIAFNYNDPIDGIDNDNDGFIDNFYGWDLGENDNLPQINYYIHGAHVSGIAAATVNNAIGIAGMGYKCKYLPIKVDDAQGNFVNSYEGIVYAAEHGCHIINCSWGGTLSNGRFGQDIIDYATFNQGCLIVAAAGNSNNDAYYYPASYHNVLSVAATDHLDQRWSSGTGTGSVFNYHIDLCAPGKNIFSTINSGMYGYSNGTSMAAPAVSAAAAILKSRFSNYSPHQLASLLRVTTDNIDTIYGNNSFKNRLGSGRINVLNAITQIDKPAIRYIHTFPEKQQFFYYQPGDTIHLYGTFINDLANAADAYAIVSSNNEFLQIVDSVFNLGIMATMQEKSNADAPFIIQLAHDIPANTIINLKIQYYANGEKNLFEYLTFIVNADFAVLKNQKINMAANSRGSLVHQNEFPLHNLGFLYNGKNISSCSGLLLGQSSSKVSDNVYAAFAGYDEDFRTINKIAKFEYPDFTKSISIFNDMNAENPLNVNIQQQFFTFNNLEKEKIVIVENAIKNTGSSLLYPLYIGWFNDFDIDNSQKNRASFYPQQNLGYIYSSNYSMYAGIILLNNYAGITHYAIDNNGAGGEINLYDANYFSTYEKFKTLTAQRYEAGTSGDGNDVSQVLSCGPFLLNSNDSIKIAFAMLTASTLNELINTAQLARNTYLSIYSDKCAKDNIENQISCYPNPANNFISIFIPELYSNYKASLIIENFLGQKVYGQKLEKAETIVNLEAFEKGIYIIKIATDSNNVYFQKIIKQ